ncbi:MAG: hypothetical protein NT099_02545 [Candidatus Saganbacteria bacterium]|nr:hypothetical protein [Candidatus Saganbacteria bacterium]
MLIKSETRFPAMQIRSAILLAVSWTRTAPSLKHLERAIEDLYLANNLRATASVKANEEKLEVEIKEEKIDAIKITVSKKGKQKTKTEVILRELGYAGLNPGDPLPADLSTLSGRISEASTFKNLCYKRL